MKLKGMAVVGDGMGGDNPENGKVRGAEGEQNMPNFPALGANEWQKNGGVVLLGV
jgi:hypothetical protein